MLPAERSNIRQSIEPERIHESLTYQVWGLDWLKHLPCDLDEGIRVEFSDFETAIPIITHLFPEVFMSDRGVNDQFFDSTPHDIRRRYYAKAGDFFIFYDAEAQDEVVGIAICTLLDWAGYNLRTVAIAPKYQNRNIYPQFFEKLCDVLRAYRINRIEGDVSATNLHHLHILNKMGYIVTAMNLTERWGALLHLTKFLDDQNRDQFGRLFSGTFKSDEFANRIWAKKRRT